MSNIKNLHQVDFSSSSDAKSNPYVIEIMPSFMNHDGSPNEQFEDFYNKLCDALPARDTKIMYELSDKSTSYDVFEEILNDTLWEGLSHWCRLPNYKKGMAISIDVTDMDMRFKPLITRLHIVTYILNVDSFTYDKPPKTKLDAEISDIYCTFKDNKYTLITRFDKFRQSQLT